MHPYLPCCFSRLAMLLIAALAVAPAFGATLTSGKVRLALAPSRVSALPIDTRKMAELLCQGKLDLSEHLRSQGDCRLTVTTTTTKEPPPPPASSPSTVWPGSTAGPERSTKSKSATAAEAGGLTGVLQVGESGSMIWSVSDLKLEGTELVDSPCGTWRASVDLEARPQPVSTVTVKPVSDGSGSGAFAGVLVLEANLHLVNLTTGQTAGLPMVLMLGMAGSWALANSQETLAGGSNVILFADLLEGELRGRVACVDVYWLGPSLAGFPLKACQLCWVNASFSVNPIDAF